MTYTPRTQLFLALATLLLISVFTQSCSVKLIAEYDEATDQAITAFHRNLSAFFLDLENKLGTPEAEFRHFAKHYQTMKIDLSAIQLRVNALDKNTITQQQIQLLTDNISLLEKLHKTGFSTDRSQQLAVLQTIQSDLNTALTAMLTLELAKRRGLQ